MALLLLFPHNFREPFFLNSGNGERVFRDIECHRNWEVNSGVFVSDRESRPETGRARILRRRTG